jgi:peptidoglycan hydrolase CwlO-like protein
MEIGQLVIGLISIIVMFIPIGGLLWKFSKMAFQVDANKRNYENQTNQILNIRKELNEIENRGSVPLMTLNNRVSKLEDRSNETEQSIVKLEVKIDSIESKLNELSIDIKQILKSIVVK